MGKITLPFQRRQPYGDAIIAYQPVDGRESSGVARVSIAFACRTFDVSETCYRYSAKLNDENQQIADLLIGPTRSKNTWGFGLCFLYLR